MAVKVSKKDRALEELRAALNWPRMPTNDEGVYFSVDGCRVIMDMVREGRSNDNAPAVEKPAETIEEVHARIEKRFRMLGRFTQGVVKGNFKALIVQGPPGLGKTYSVDQVLDDYDPNGVNTTKISGKLSTPQLFKQLWDHREEGQILVIDDCDSVFTDDVSLNLLKAALDSGKKRVVSYMTEDNKVSEKDGSIIDKRFEFNGTVIFITNLDFDSVIESKSRLAVHLEALKSRSTYVSLGMRSRAEYMVRIEQISGSLFQDFDADCEAEVLGFMRAYLDELDEVSARMAKKVATLREAFPEDWQDMAMESCFRI